jgi:hypothetical protein
MDEQVFMSGSTGSPHRHWLMKSVLSDSVIREVYPAIMVGFPGLARNLRNTTLSR